MPCHVKRRPPRVTEQGCLRAAHIVWPLVKKVSKHQTRSLLAAKTYELRLCLHRGHSRIDDVAGLACVAALTPLPSRWELTLRDSEYEERLVYEAAVKDLCAGVARYASEAVPKTRPSRGAAASAAPPLHLLDLGDDIVRLVLCKACYTSHSRSLLVPGFGAARARLVCSAFARCGRALLQARQAAVVEDVALQRPIWRSSLASHYLANLSSDCLDHHNNNVKLRNIQQYLSPPRELEDLLTGAVARWRGAKEAEVTSFMAEQPKLLSRATQGCAGAIDELMWHLARVLLRTASHSKRADFCRTFWSFVEGRLHKRGDATAEGY